MKKFLTVFSSVVGVILLVAGIAILIDRFLLCGDDSKSYLECDCNPEAE